MLGDLTIDHAERRVTLAGRSAELQAKEYQLLYELSVNAGRVLTTTRCTEGSGAPRSRTTCGRSART